MKEMYSFDDFLMEPKYSDLSSRSEVELSVRLPKGFKFDFPVLPSSMKAVASEQVLQRCYRYGMMGLLHRFEPIENQLHLLNKLDDELGRGVFNFIGASIGVKDADYRNLPDIINTGCKIINIDIAHGHSKLGIEMTKYVAEHYPDVLLIAPNVATVRGMEDLFRAGADIVKLAIGNGSICTTRIQTKNGAPQMSLLMDTYRHKQEMEKELGRQLLTISDGGVRTAGDIAMALLFSDLVMSGNLFARTEEAAGETIEIEGVKYKHYEGSSTHKKKHIEGVKGLVAVNGTFSELYEKINDGLTSACSYQGVRNLEDFKKDPTLIKITHGGMVESGSHDLEVVFK